MTGYIGAAVNTANFNITLKPSRERKISADQVINRLRPKLARVPGATLFLQAVQDVQIGGRMGNAQFQYTLQGDNLQDLLTLGAARAAEAARRFRSCATSTATCRTAACEAGLVIDRDTAGRLGISASTIDNALYDAFGQRQVSTMYKGINQYHVVMEVDPQVPAKPRRAQESLRPFLHRASHVPLSAFTHYEPSTTSLAVAHQGQFPAVTFSFNLAPNVPLGDAVTAVQNAERTHRSARHHPSRLSGHRAGLSGLAGHRAAS